MSKPAWKLDSSEITWGWGATTIGKRRKVNRASRAIDERSEHFWLEHKPTGIRVQGEIPMGHRSRKQGQKLKQELYDRLYAELEDEIAKHLRVPGR